MSNLKKMWVDLLGEPTWYKFEKQCGFIKRYSFDEFDVELHLQSNGPGTYQRIMMALPKKLTAPAPAVVVPFYFPEAMLGFDPENGEVLENFSHIAMTADLARRGVIAATADAYHVTYVKCDPKASGFDSWRRSSSVLLYNHPRWTGMGKLVYDTARLTHFVLNDPRVESSRLGIAGHSLGGKMAFYNGCLDERFKVILASDFGFGWHQSNWEQPWYWGEKLSELKAQNIDHISLLSAAQGKPFMLLAGHYDNEESFEMMNHAAGYGSDKAEKLQIINHATGHRPPDDVLHKGYEFLLKYL